MLIDNTNLAMEKLFQQGVLRQKVGQLRQKIFIIASVKQYHAGYESFIRA